MSAKLTVVPFRSRFQRVVNDFVTDYLADSRNKAEMLGGDARFIESTYKQAATDGAAYVLRRLINNPKLDPETLLKEVLNSEI